MFEEDGASSASQNQGENPAASVQTDQSGQTQGTDANPNSTESPSGSGTDAKTDPAKSLTDVVSDALKAGKGASSPSEGQPVGQKLKAGQTDPKASGQPGQKDGGAEDVPQEFHKHPAWQRLKKERDTARADVERYRKDSDEFNAVTGYMQEHNIAVEEVAEALQWMALRNTDPAKFGQMIIDLAAQVQESMGLVLPKELQARVESGEITEEDAKALARAKAEANLYKQQSTTQAERQNTQKQADQQRQTAEQMATTVNQWERQIQQTDPDYGRKKRLVETEIRSYIQQFGMPKNPQQALKYAQVAYEEVTKTLGGLLPQKKPNNPTPSGGKQVETTYTPKSLEDVVSHALTGGG